MKLRDIVSLTKANSSPALGTAYHTPVRAHMYVMNLLKNKLKKRQVYNRSRSLKISCTLVSYYPTSVWKQLVDSQLP